MAPPVDCEISIKLVNGITDSYRHSKQLFGVATLLYADLFYIVNWTLNWDVIGHVFNSPVYRAVRQLYTKWHRFICPTQMAIGASLNVFNTLSCTNHKGWKSLRPAWRLYFGQLNLLCCYLPSSLLHDLTFALFVLIQFHFLAEHCSPSKNIYAYF